MPGKYRAIYKDGGGNKIDEIEFPMCSEDKGAKDTINSYGKAQYENYETADVYNGNDPLGTIKRT